MLKLLIILLISLPFSSFASVATENASPPKTASLVPYKANYSLTWNKIKVGTSLHILKKLNSEQYSAEVLSTPTIKILPYRSFEKSIFSIKHLQVVPQEYQYNQKEKKREHIGNIIFDWNNKKINVLQGESPPDLNLPPNAYDKLTENLQLRLDLQSEFNKGKRTYDYTVVERNKIQVYTFNIIKEEKIQTALGLQDIIVVAHHSENKERKTLIWLAKNLHYLPVKLQQFKKGKLTVEINIKAYEPLS